MKPTYLTPQEYFRSMIDSIRFPLRIPIIHKNLYLGRLLVGYEIEAEELQNIDKLGVGPQLIDEIEYLEDRLQLDFQIALDIYDDILMKNRLNVERQVLFNIFKGENQSLLDTITDDEIFSQIEKHGFGALSQWIVVNRMSLWSRDKSHLGRNINSLGKALKEHAKIAHLPEKGGGPEKELIRRFSPKFIKSLHEDLTAILKIAKRYKREYSACDINELLNIAFALYISSLSKEAKKSPGSEELKRKVSQLKRGFQGLILARGSNPLAQFILSDDELKDDFNKFSEEPFKFSLRIMAKIFEASYEKVRKVVHYKQDVIENGTQ